MKKAKQEVIRVPYTPAEGADAIERELAKMGLPLTRANWLALNYPFDPIPDPYPPELEAQMPNSIRLPEYRDDEE